MVGATSWDVAFLAWGSMGICFARYILFFDGRFFFLSFLLDYRLHTFLFYWIVVYILISISREAPPLQGCHRVSAISRE